MIELELSGTTNQRLAMLNPYIGYRVTAKDGAGHVCEGILARVGATRKKTIFINVGGTHLDLSLIVACVVHTGGDWKVASEHSDRALTARIRLRCHPRDKARIANAAKARGISVSEFVLNAALANARR